MISTRFVLLLGCVACSSGTDMTTQTESTSGATAGAAPSTTPSSTAAVGGAGGSGTSGQKGSAGRSGAPVATNTAMPNTAAPDGPSAPTAGSRAEPAAGQSAAGAGGSGATMNSAGSVAAAAGSGSMEPTVACDPADKTPDPTPVNWSDTDTPPTGKYKVVIESDPGIPSQTIYRPVIGSEERMPIIVWGNGGCVKMGLVMAEFLHDVASHGFLIIADGPAQGGSGPGGSGGSVFKNSIDWAFAENERPCSQYYHKLDTSKVAASGQSCGGLMTYEAAGDPRLTTLAIFNSGGADSATLNMIHTPVAWFNGGSSDIASANGARDYQALSMTAKFPLFHGNNMLGHGGTYNDDNGGECARVGVGWFRWQLLGDEGDTGKNMFWGPDCSLCKDSGWTVERVNMGM